MALRFKSFLSGSGGNAALLWSEGGGLLVDFGPGSQRDCRAIIAEAGRLCGNVLGVLVTHAHGDHINKNSLKVLSESGLKVYCHRLAAEQIKTRCGADCAGVLAPFGDALVLGDFTVTQAEVPHAPGYHTCALDVTWGRGLARRRAAVFTDLHSFGEMHVAFAAGADLLLLEANHDPELRRLNPHPGSEYHLSNPLAADFLRRVCEADGPPQAVVLAHLSADCNRPDLPEREVRAHFKKKKRPLKFRLHTAPRDGAGEILEID
ncbi:MAG TPA: MBL fold metallo-hydrolase [Elusimicrobiales bacterium]|nr:MBL fold metallo-hydrolase [Elusimicrobiales bacterium]